MQLHPAERLALELAARRDQALEGDLSHRRARGIVHTPPELARFVVRGVDHLLRSEHGLAGGLADPDVQLVDPACGPGAFLAAALALCAERGALLPARLIGCDVDGRALEAASGLAAHCASVSTLELVEADTLRTPHLLEELATRRQVSAIVGNPPWVSAASEPSAYMQALLEDFRRDERGQRLPERKLGVLADAYVRFVRWAAELARRCERGAVLGLVTNGSYLDGMMHRGMRAALARWFSDVYVVDLGGSALLGNARKAERDDNVFGVRPGVAITFCSLHGDPARRTPAGLRYVRVRGSKAHKLAQLAERSFEELDWTSLPRVPGCLYVPRRAPSESYERWPSLAQCMPFHREGVQSNRDAMVVDVDRDQLVSRLHAFAAGRVEARIEAAGVALPHYDPERARHAVARAIEEDPDGLRGVLVRPLAYRPFDDRWFFPRAPLCHRPRPELLAACDHADVALLCVRKDRGDLPYAHFALSRFVADSSFLSARSSCRTRVFPLHTNEGRENLADSLRQGWARDLGVEVDVRAFVTWVSCVLACPTYRLRHAEALRSDYPRIPPPREPEALARAQRLFSELTSAFTSALPARAEALPVSGPQRVSALSLRAEGERAFLCLGGDPIRELRAGTLELRIGHHDVLREYLRAQRNATLSEVTFGQVLARIERIERLVELFAAASEVVEPSLAT